MPVENVSAYKDLLIVLATAGLVMPVFLRLGLSSIIGFLLVGVVLGPHILGQITSTFPQLSFLTLSQPREVAGLAELGVVFLMFLIGLELSLERLKTMRRLIFGLGTIQIIASTIALTALARWYGLAPIPAFVTAMALSLSSTAIVIQLLAEKKRTGSQTGRISFSVLLAQDLAVIRKGSTERYTRNCNSTHASRARNHRDHYCRETDPRTAPAFRRFSQKP
jgi:Kef-type K+ transport system membrane component KefB